MISLFFKQGIQLFKKTILALTIIFIGLESFYLIMEQVQIVDNTKQPQLKKKTIQITQIPWYKFQNERFGFEFYYPQDWKVTSWDAADSLDKKNASDNAILYKINLEGFEKRVQLLIWQNNNKYSIYDWLIRHHSEIPKDLIPQQSNIQVAQHPALRFLVPTDLGKKPVIYIFLAKDDKIFEFNEELTNLTNEELLSENEPQLEEHEIIIQSFAFLR